MFDLLILAGLGGKYLYDKFIQKKDWTLEDAKNGLIEIAKKHDEDSDRIKSGMAQLVEVLRKQEQTIERIQAERNGLASELQWIREVEIKRHNGIYIFGSIAVLALILAIFDLFNRH